MFKKPLLPILVLASLFLASCVSSKKYTKANDEIAKVSSQNQELKQQVNELNGQYQSLSTEHKTLTTEYSSYKTTCEANQKQLAAYESAIQELQNNLEALRKAIDGAVASFEGKGLEVTEKDGRVHVNMQDNLLFKSGSSKVEDNGKKALEALAGALMNYPKLEVIIVGHTDSVNFKNSKNDNLNLSTDRANNVLRILRDDYGVNPERLIAAGQGKYAPVADNATEEGRAKNRRTDIILLPDLQRIWDAVNNGEHASSN